MFVFPLQMLFDILSRSNFTFLGAGGEQCGPGLPVPGRQEGSPRPPGGVGRGKIYLFISISNISKNYHWFLSYY